MKYNFSFSAMRADAAAHYLLRYGRRGALLLAMSGLVPAGWGQGFGPVNTYNTGIGSGPYSAVLNDVNGDGRLDIVAVNYASSSMGVLLSQAGGGFAAAVSYAIGAGGNGLAQGDLNGDGLMDFVIGSGSTVRVLLGQAGGGFAPFSSYTAGIAGNNPNGAPGGEPSVAFDVVLDDVNGDGRLDIVSANSTAHTVGVLLGQAGGGFATFTAYSTGAGTTPVGVALGDVNGDGQLDIVTANVTSNNVGVLLGQASGGFAPVAPYFTGLDNRPIDVALGDVNGDGRLDIVAANSAVSTGSSVGVLLGQTGGGFAPIVTYPTAYGSSPRTLALGDMNGDSRLDIVVSDSYPSHIGLLLGQAGGFAPMSTYSTGTGNIPYGVALGDVNGDGRPDIVATHWSTDIFGVLLNTGNFAPLATASSQALAAAVSLYPNPTHAGFTVQLPTSFGPVQADLLNALGQAVRCSSASGLRFSVDTNGLAPGIYTLRLASSAGTLAKRVVVE